MDRYSWRRCLRILSLLLLINIGCGKSTHFSAGVHPVIMWKPPAGIVAGTALSAAQLNAAASVPGSFIYSPASGTVLSPGTHTLTTTFTPVDSFTYQRAKASVNITVTEKQPVTPIISWTPPADISEGTSLGSNQLNATSNVPGSFAYNPSSGTVLPAGTHTLTTTFTPADATTYKSATASVNITVTQIQRLTPAITWARPASISEGTALGPGQLDATSSVPGSFAYSPPAGTVLPVGIDALSATFTPTDSVHYAAETATNSITVTSNSTTSSGVVINVDPSMSTQEIQSALNSAPTGATISFASGTYDVSSSIIVPCANLQLTGPVTEPPTATLSASFENSSILVFNGGCPSLGAIRYLGFANSGAVYVGVGNNGNFVFEHNAVSHLPSMLSNIESEAGLYFDGNLGTTLSNVVVQNNTFGDATSCTSAFATATDEGGYCAGVLTSQGANDHIAIESNRFDHVEEGIHYNQLQAWSPGAQDSICVSCKIDGNYIRHYHRIGIEIQVETPTDPVRLEHNAVVDPLNSSYGTFAVSLACCNWGKTMAVTGNSPGVVFNDNVLIASQPCGYECPPFGVEFWGTGSQGTNSLVEGTFSNGYTWGYGAGSWAIDNNYICGPNYPSQGGYISNEEHQNNPPAESGNITSGQCQSMVSVAPTISPAGGAFSTSQVVTLNDSGPNTGIWYTTDGSDPVPGGGTSKYYDGPFTISGTTTIKAVGMWGNQMQPPSYPAGYGYVPSGVVSATFVGN